MKAIRYCLSLGLALACVGCKIEIFVPQGGRVETTSGAHSCEAGETCVIDVTNAFFDETFEARPNPGFTFTAWRRKASAFCGGLESACRLLTTAFPGTPLEPLLASDDTFFLEPVFARSNTWVNRAAMPTSRVIGGACVIRGRIYIIGGQQVGAQAGVSTVEMYDPATNSWSTRASLPRALMAFSTGVVKNKCYVFGGGDYGPGISDEVYVYDPREDAWSSRQPMPTPRFAASSAVVNGKIYVIGGGVAWHSFSPGSDAVEEYDPKTDSWRTRASMPTPRWALSATAINGTIYVLGGQNPLSGVSESSKVERYDVDNNRWTTAADLPTDIAWYPSSAATTAGKLYVFGGASEARRVYDNVYEYDPALNRWQSRTPLPSAAWGTTASTVDGQIYVIGGSSQLGPGHDSLSENRRYTH